MKEKVDVSIIIVNYNTVSLLKQCVNSIYQYSEDIDFEIIVIDNASIDGSCEMIMNEFPNVVLIESKENLGFGMANNEAVKLASGDFLFLLNSDTILIENSVKVLKEYLENTNNLEVAVVGCKLLDINKNPHISYGNFPSLYQELFEFGLSKIFRKFYCKKLSPSIIDDGTEVKEVDYIMGADMFIRKAIFDKIGGFDQDFFLYYEETEICFRLKRLGYKIIYTPETSIIHYLGASGKNIGEINYWIVDQLQKSKILYFKKCHGATVATLIKYITLPKALMKYRKFDIRKIWTIFLKH
jgi:GT2 family glycosyltransferase